MYRNSEGYSDPTAGTAMSHVIREYRKQQKENWLRRNEIMGRPLVYVASRYAGDISANMEAAAKACRYTADMKKIPVCSHLMYPAMGFNDADPDECEMCCLYGMALLARCDEVWCFTVNGEFSAGMKAEAAEAKRLGKPVRYFGMEEI